MNLIKRLACILAFGLSMQVVQCALPPHPLAAKKVGTNIVDFNNILTNGTNVQACFQPKIYHPAGYNINGNDLEYVYFNVAQADGQAIPGNFTFHDADVDNKVAETYNIYFPADGSQPTTQNAAQYSCANIGAYEENHLVTKWYIKAFGGDTGLELAQGNSAPASDTAPKFGFQKLPKHTVETITSSLTTTVLSPQMIAEHIIIVEGDNNFKQAFWKTFKIIASNPVGRVLLYRLLIEIRRQNSRDVEFMYTTFKDKIKAHTGSIEYNNDIIILDGLGERNNCRSIKIKEGANSFSLSRQSISFTPSNNITTSVLKIDNNSVKTEQNTRSADIGLFHEMLHWFHYLRDYERYSKDRKFDGSYCYLMECYLGNNKLQEIFNQYNELFAWATIEYKEEELRTILGTPNYDDNDEFKIFSNNVFATNTTSLSECIKIRAGTKEERYINSSGKFLNGDDLSENAYRISCFESEKTTVKMRFGHADNIKPVYIHNKNTTVFEVDGCLLHKYRFMLPNLVAAHCYKNITSKAPNWSLTAGEAAN